MTHIIQIETLPCCSYGGCRSTIQVERHSDRDGKILFLTRLFDQKEFNEMKKVITQSLSKD